MGWRLVISWIEWNHHTRWHTILMETFGLTGTNIECDHGAYGVLPEVVLMFRNDLEGWAMSLKGKIAFVTVLPYRTGLEERWRFRQRARNSRGGGIL
jgi:hypothetical protein